MAKVQTRRTISISRARFEAAKKLAEAKGMTLSAFTEAALAAAGVEVEVPRRDFSIVLAEIVPTPADPPKPQPKPFHKQTADEVAAILTPPAHRASWVETRPGICAVCTSDVGPFAQEPFGRNGAMVSVCQRCRGEHPNKGGYSFSGGADTSGSESRLDRLNGHRRAGGNR